MLEIPNFLNEILHKQYPNEVTKIIKGYSTKRPVTLRVNTLKTNLDEVEKELDQHNILYHPVAWYKEALIIDKACEKVIRTLSIYQNGLIYLQNLSSMLPALLLEPHAAENILDMAASPGGKTTQIVTLSPNVLLTACEKNIIRSERLKYNIDKQGASRVNVLVGDALKLDDCLQFDKILLDAPCSGSGTLSLPINTKVFNEKLINRSVKTETDLLFKAIRLLKPGKEMIYSTCSILKQENEEVIKKVLSSGEVELVPLNDEWLKELPQLPTTIPGVICLCPTDLYEGFFVAKLRKK